MCGALYDLLSPPPRRGIATGVRLGHTRAGLPVRGFNGVMQHARIALFHPLNVEC